mgnify:CR=1 FL=1
MDEFKQLLNISPENIKYDLQRTYQLLKACNNPEKNITTIQIVGTNGKGSTASFIANILKNANYKIGLYTSPHLIDFKERIRINFKAIKSKDIKQFLSNYKKEISKIKPSFFEIMTVMALWYFHKNKIKIAVLEAGLGGRLDSTTACLNQYIVFTSISMDHKEILGDTIEKITQEKAAAITNTNQYCIANKNNKIIDTIIKSRADQLNVPVNFIQLGNQNFKLNYLHGEHQKENAFLAINLVKLLNKHKLAKVSLDNIYSYLSSTKWPGRFQKIASSPNIIFDVCHNAESIKMFYNNLNNSKSSSTKYLICGFEYNKEIKKELKQMSHMFKVIICTETNIRKSMKAEDIQNIFDLSSVDVECIINPIAAINQAIKYAINTDEIYIIGSHFFGPFIAKQFKNCFAIEE